MTLREPSELESARQARRSIALIRRKLLHPTPEILESCTPHLRTAIQCMERLLKLLGDAPFAGAASRDALQSEVMELSRELAQLNALLRGASNYHFGLASLLLPARDEAIGYSAAGAIGMAAVPSLVLEG